MKKILIIIGVIELIGFINCFPQKILKFEASADLNGDGTAEHIVLTGIEDLSTFALNISGLVLNDAFDDGAPDYMEIIDIAESDKYKEILIQSSGASDDYEYLIYWYDGKEIHAMDHPFNFSQPSFPGSGFIYTTTWAGFYIRTEKYQYDPSVRSFTEIPQYAYYVGIKVNVLKPFTIYADEALTQKVALLSKDSEIDIILDRYSDVISGTLFLVKSQTGLIGWMKEEGISNYLQLPIAG